MEPSLLFANRHLLDMLVALRRSPASGLADLEIDDRSVSSDWIRQCSFESCPSRFRLSNRQYENTTASVWVIGFVRFHGVTMTCRISFRVLPRLRTDTLYTRRVDFPLHVLHHSPSSVPSSAPSTQPSPFPPWLSTPSLLPRSVRSSLAIQRSS